MTVRKETLRVPGRREVVSEVRSWLETTLAEWATPEDAAADLLLAVSEVCNNIIRHGFKDAGDGEIEIQAFWEKDQVRVTVVDTAPPFTPPYEVAPSLLDPLMDSGRGLFLIGTLMDEISYQSLGERGNRTVLVKRIDLGTEEEFDF